MQATKQQAREDAQEAALQTLGGFLEHKYSTWLLAERPEKRRGAETLQRLRANFAALLEQPLTEITPWVIEKWRADQRKHGKAPAAINRDVTTLRSVLSKAVAWRIIDPHPLAPLKPLKVDAQATIRYMTTEEERRLCTALQRRDISMKAARTSANAWRRERGYAELPMGDTLCSAVALAVCQQEGIALTFNCLDTTSFARTGASVPETDTQAMAITHG